MACVKRTNSFLLQSNRFFLLTPVNSRCRLVPVISSFVEVEMWGNFTEKITTQYLT